MPHLSRKDAELVIGLLRRHPDHPHGGSTPEARLLRRLEQRVAKPLEALNNWKRRGHTEMVNRLSAAGAERRTNETRSPHCRTEPAHAPPIRRHGGPA
jgi:hypothetical protein